MSHVLGHDAAVRDPENPAVTSAVNYRPPGWAQSCSGACRTCSHLQAQSSKFVMVGRVEYSMSYGCRRHNGHAPHAPMQCADYEREPGSDDDGVPAPVYRGPRSVLEPMPPAPPIRPYVPMSPPEPAFEAIFAKASTLPRERPLFDDDILRAWEEEEKSYDRVRHTYQLVRGT
jgi:hypothetical protein